MMEQEMRGRMREKYGVRDKKGVRRGGVRGRLFALGTERIQGFSSG